jgi:hypothetical protein
MLNVPANLDGEFLINVNFCKREDLDEMSEAIIIDAIQADLDGIGIGKFDKIKRNNKHNFK